MRDCGTAAMLNKFINGLLWRNGNPPYTTGRLVALGSDYHKGHTRFGQPLYYLRTVIEQDDEVYWTRQRNVQSRIVCNRILVLKHGNLRKEKSVVRKHLAYLFDAYRHLAVEVMVAHHAQHMPSPDGAFGRQNNRAAPWTRQHKPFLRKSAVGRAHNDLAYAQMPRQLRHGRQNSIGLVKPGMNCITQATRQLIRETIAACPIQLERTNGIFIKPIRLHHAHIISHVVSRNHK